MNQKQLQRLKVIENAVEGKLTVVEAAVLLGISPRQVKRYKARFDPQAHAWVLHGNDGREAHNRYPDEVVEQIAALATGKYKGFNDSHLWEKLTKVEKFTVSRETVRAILRSREGLRGKTYYCLLGLLSVTGLRISEPVNLERADVDFEESILSIRKTKFGKTRLVPLHPSTVAVLVDYAAGRDVLAPNPTSTKFFLNENGRPLLKGTVQGRFREVCRRIGMQAPNDKRGPPLHDSGTGSPSIL